MKEIQKIRNWYLKVFILFHFHLIRIDYQRKMRIILQYQYDYKKLLPNNF